jgi:hypothetical protein
MTEHFPSRALLAHRRARAEERAVRLLAIAALTLAIIRGAVIISGWFAGVIEDGPERVFWTGAILDFVMVGVFAAAVFPGGDDDARVLARISFLTRIGVVLFMIAPALCIGALVADFY